MALAVAADSTPVRVDAHGVARVGDTRVRLASIVHRHRQGDSPIEIHERVPSLSLSDDYAAVAYYLRYQAEEDAYLAEQDSGAKQIREEIEARPETRELREILRAPQTAEPLSLCGAPVLIVISGGSRPFVAYAGAVMLAFGLAMVLRTVHAQQKALEELRTRLGER